MKNIEKINNKIRLTEVQEVDVEDFIKEEETKLLMVEQRIEHIQKMLDDAQEERRQIKKNIKDYK